MTATQIEKSRETWSSRLAFFSASVGSAVGLGNLWRFPSSCATYGGGAFLLPYILGLVFVGLPILTLEFALGQVFRSGDVHSFGSINRRLSGVGVGSIICGFMVTCYYVIILAWAFLFFIHSFRSATSADGTTQFVWSAFDAENGGPGSFLMSQVIGTANETNWQDGSLNRSTTLVKDTYWALTLIWVLIFLCIFKGPKTTGRITYATMGLPFIFLIMFAITFGSLEGASDGVAYYASFNFTQLSGEDMCGGGPCRDAWPAAIGQVFFSLSITFGVMTAYSSYNPKSQGIAVNAMVTGFSDMVVSIIAGFCVFTAVGVLTKIQQLGGEDVEVADVAGGASGFGLVFITYPTAIEALAEKDVSFAGRQTLAVLWFGMIVLLGIDSAFSLVEGFITSFKDSRLFNAWSRPQMAFVVCIVGYLIGLEYSTDTGLYALDAVDYYINLSMMFVGFMECVCAGWMYDYERHIEQIGSSAWWTALGSFALACYYGPRVGLGYGGAAGTTIGFIFGFFIFAVGAWAAMTKAAAKSGQPLNLTDIASVKLVFKDVFLFNIENLRATFNTAAGKSRGNIEIPFVWTVLIKFLIPPILMLNLIMSFMSSKFGTYGGYHQWYQGWGIFIGALPWAAIAVNLVLPNVFEQLLPEAVEVEAAVCKVEEAKAKDAKLPALIYDQDGRQDEPTSPKPEEPTSKPEVGAL